MTPAFRQAASTAGVRAPVGAEARGHRELDREAGPGSAEGFSEVLAQVLSGIHLMRVSQGS